MKKTKVIIPALGLLLLSTAASVSGTVAWFAMNASVTATGMQITAKSDSVFLLIGSGETDTVSEIQTANSTTTALTVGAEEAKVLPSAHDSITNTATATATDVSNLHHYQLIAEPHTEASLEEYAGMTSEQKALYEGVNQAGTNWYYKIADSATASASTKGAHYLATVDSAYIIHKICYVTLAAGSNDATNLRIKSATVASNSTATGLNPTLDPVKILVTSATNCVEFDKDGLTNDSTVLAAAVTDDEVVQLDIFIYYNGADDDVYTNNVANLDGATVNFAFDVNR